MSTIPWGKLLTSTGTFAAINPLRYRGYYYDTETGFYYLQSRYYDPAISRFINVDSYAATGGLLGYNMFAYCENNPVNALDSSGSYPIEVGDNPDKRPMATVKPVETAIKAVIAIAIQGIGPVSKPELSLYDKIKRTFWSVFTSMTLDAGVGAGKLVKGNLLGLIKGGMGEIHDLFAIHCSYYDGLNLGEYDEYNFSAGIGPFSAGPVRHRFISKWSYGGQVDSEWHDEAFGLLGIDLGYYKGFGGRFSVGFDTTKIINDIQEIWWS